MTAKVQFIHAEQMFLHYIWLTSEKNKTDKRMLYSTLPGWPTCTCSCEEFSFHPVGIPAKSSEIPPWWTALSVLQKNNQILKSEVS